MITSDQNNYESSETSRHAVKSNLMSWGFESLAPDWPSEQTMNAKVIFQTEPLVAYYRTQRPQTRPKVRGVLRPQDVRYFDGTLLTGSISTRNRSIPPLTSALRILFWSALTCQRFGPNHINSILAA